MAAGNAQQSLSGAVQAADARVTILDDKLDVENAAIHRWLKAHRLHGAHLGSLVLGDEPLTPAWKARCLPMKTDVDAEQLLKAIKGDAHALGVLRTLAVRKWGAVPGGHGDAVVLERAEKGLVAGDLWAMHLTSMTSRWQGKPNLAGLAQINRKKVPPTSVDFAFVAAAEDTKLRGYIPISKGKVIGGSGMTIATGLDLGMSVRKLTAMGVPKDLVTRFTPYAGMHFTGKTTAEVVAIVGKTGPIPTITQPEADLIDPLVFESFLSDAMNAWERGRRPDLPAFAALPPGWQTVIFSRAYNSGPGFASTAVSGPFGRAAFGGRWKDAIAALRSMPKPYTDRGRAEAALCEAALPPDPAPLRKPAPK